MRKHLVWVLGLAIAIGVAAVATGASTQRIKAKITPSKQSKVRFGPASVDFTIAASCRADVCSDAINGISRLRIYLDDDIRISTRGLARCSESQLALTTTAEAKARCPRAQVGFGFGTVRQQFEIRAFPVVFTAFNSTPQGGRPTLLIHSHVSYPGGGYGFLFTAVLKPASGDFGTLVDARLPLLPGGAVLVSFQNKWQKSYFFRGQRRHFISARCSDRDRIWNFKVVGTYFGNTPSNLATQKCTVKR